MKRSLATISKNPSIPFSVLICSFPGGTQPSFAMPNSSKALLVRFNEIATVFNKDGSYNRNSRYAEQYALCLLHEKHSTEALKLLAVIIGDSQDVLFINDPPTNGVYHSQEVANRPGKLGFITLWWYATTVQAQQPERAIALYRELAEKIPVRCYPGGLSDIRVNALHRLKKIGISEINGNPIDKEIADADDHCW